MFFVCCGASFFSSLQAASLYVCINSNLKTCFRLVKLRNNISFFLVLFGSFSDSPQLLTIQDQLLYFSVILGEWLRQSVSSPPAYTAEISQLFDRLLLRLVQIIMVPRR